MNIAVLGYGKMGKAVEKCALERGHCIVCRIDNAQDWENATERLKNARVAIDFSIPDTAPGNIRRCFALDLPVVVGTTGWNRHREEIGNLCREGKHALFVSSNFSIGVYLFNAAARFLAEKMQNFAAYTPSITEEHHIHKLDAPSGTAVTLKNEVSSVLQRCPDIPIESIRRGETVGIHTLEFSGNTDKISLTHEAFSREGFAWGAVNAAEWLVRQKEENKHGVFGMKDMLGF